MQGVLFYMIIYNNEKSVCFKCDQGIALIWHEPDEAHEKKQTVQV